MVDGVATIGYDEYEERMSDAYGMDDATQQVLSKYAHMRDVKKTIAV